MAKLIFERGSVRVWVEPVVPNDSDATGIALQQAAKRRLLTEVIGVEELWHTADGAPYICGMESTVSLSHCGGVVALAIDGFGCRVGLDAEMAGRGGQLRRVASRYLSKDQLTTWGRNDHVLLQAWTLKEALYKACRIPGWPLCQIPLPCVSEMCGGGQSLLSVNSGNYKPQCELKFVCNKITFDGFDGVISLVREVF